MSQFKNPLAIPHHFPRWILGVRKFAVKIPFEPHITMSHLKNRVGSQTSGDIVMWDSRGILNDGDIVMWGSRGILTANL